MTLSRRTFLQSLLASAAAAAVFDPERLLWVPGAKTIIDTHVVTPTFAIGDLVYITTGAPVDHVATVVGRPMGRLASVSQMAYFNDAGVRMLAKCTGHMKQTAFGYEPHIDQMPAGCYMGRSGEMSIIQMAVGSRVVTDMPDHWGVARVRD